MCTCLGQWRRENGQICVLRMLYVNQVELSEVGRSWVRSWQGHETFNQLIPFKTIQNLVLWRILIILNGASINR